MPLVQIRHLTKEYRQGDRTIIPLHDVNLQIERGDFLALTGASGSGKTTLLNLLVGLDRPSAGQIVVEGIDLGLLSKKELAHWRAGHVGYVIQLGNLIPLLSVVENVELPLMLLGISFRERRRRAAAALESVGLSGQSSRHPAQLSGGQAKRVGIARAIVAEPDIVVADEPTAELDAAAAEGVLQVLQHLNRECKTTLFLVTHDAHAAERAARHLRLEEGRLSECEQPRKMTG